MNNKLKALVIPAMLTMSVLLLVLASAPAGASPNKKEGTVYYGSNEQILVGTWTKSTDLHFIVTSNTTIDVYILTAADIVNYPSGSFSPVKAIENTKSADFKVKSDTTNSYYLIIDNRDNSRSSDAIPTGNAAYNATYPNWLDSTGDTVTSIMNTCIMGAIAVVVIIIVVIIIVVYFVVIRKKPQPPVVQTPYTAPPVQYQQPAYQPQPQPYAPAPPSQYEPPPPPPQQGYSQPPAPPGQQYPPQ